jgi:hypothetical protein
MERIGASMADETPIRWPASKRSRLPVIRAVNVASGRMLEARIFANGQNVEAAAIA